MIFRFSIAIIAFCVGLATSGKAEQSDQVVLVGNDLAEVLHKSAQISGVRLVGAALKPLAQAENLYWSAHLPSAWAGQDLCVSMLTSDGLYEARNTYRISDTWGGGAITVEYPTRYQRKIFDLAEDEFGIMASLGSCDQNKTDAVLPVTWRGSAPENRIVRLFINSFRADEVYLFVGDDPAAEPVLCQPPKAQFTTAFDFLCEFGLAPGDGPVAIEINRVSSGQILPPEYVTLLLDAAR